MLSVKTAEVSASWLDGLASDNTRAAYGRDLAGFTAWCDSADRDPLDARDVDVARYRDDAAADGLSTATIARRLSALSSFFDHAVAVGAITTNPVDAVDRVRSTTEEQPSLDDDEATAMYAAAVAAGPKVATLVSLLLLDGMKLAEVLALDVDDVVRSGRSMHVVVERRGSSRALVLDERTAATIKRYVAGRTRGPLLVGDSPTQERGARLTRFGADYLVKRAARDADLGVVSANTLRRTHKRTAASPSS